MQSPDFWSECRDSNPRPLGPEPYRNGKPLRKITHKSSNIALNSSSFYNNIIANFRTDCKGNPQFSLAFLLSVDLVKYEKPLLSNNFLHQHSTIYTTFYISPTSRIHPPTLRPHHCMTASHNDAFSYDTA